ncbi:Gfo/Idh/MocA family oxidoreductase [Labedaea rhizosphaerae]|uniref:Oxidoreductase family protein n=1 Tax=Labedaea rhizosphaerae TaxID=598644 RepID=A0A4R6S6L2_LABRH|nr:Gfo/Idh/MocA family oxidoreductase [Labedaea rhizosphaerae]TDP94954.1 oxidoreductase family protein [Labedaea rhizosphaerae]
MTRVGLHDLATSHPGIFAPLLAGLGMPVTAVHDPVAARVDGFLRAHPGVVATASLAELAAVTDVVMLLGRDWDQRLTQVEELVALGVPVFVDKPMAGTAAELRRIADLADAGARIDGGSALRVAPEAVAVPPCARLEVTCDGHPLYYGVHAVALATAVLGPGLVASAGTPGDTAHAIRGVIEHASGAKISVSVTETQPAGGFRAVGPDGVIEPSADLFYAALLGDALPRLTSAAPARPGRSLVECELALLAMAWSAATGGAPVRLDDVPPGFRPWRP